MALAPDKRTPGLWTDESVQGGLFALVVGVSHYKHFPGGTGDPAEEAFGLEQLPASALSAYRFFEWLITNYRLAGLPIARARLLLSPRQKKGSTATADELRGCDKEIIAHATGASFNEIAAAIRAWYADMRAASRGSQSRSLFFFSGHGLEIRAGHQVLLPSDYLQPPNGSYNDAISTRNLVECLPFLQGVPSHILMLDGCRNDIDELRSSGVVGVDVLNRHGPGATNPLYEQSVLSATTSGLKAYSPLDGRLSLFTQAMMDGLTNDPDPTLNETPLKITRRDAVNTIQINKLASYMKGRVDALIRDAKSDVLQVVRVDTSSPDPEVPIEVTELAGAEVWAPMRGGGGGDLSSLELKSLDPIGRAMSGFTNDWFERRYPKVVKPGKWQPPSVSYLHGLFSSEAITYPWLDSLRVTTLSGPRSRKSDSLWIHAVRHGKQTRGLRQIQVDFTLRQASPPDRGDAYVLSVKDTSERRLACLLPVGRQEGTVFQLEIDVGEDRAGRHSFLRFAAYLSQEQPGQLGRAARIWDQLRAEDASAATELLTESDLARLEDLLADKEASPVAALTAGLVLLKANHFDLMHDWPRNLADWFEWLPDGVVLWTEQRRRERELDSKLAKWFVDKLSRRPLPFTSECLALAAGITRDITQGRIRSDAPTLAAAMTLEKRLDAVMPYFRDWGLFASYVAWNEPLALVPKLWRQYRG